MNLPQTADTHGMLCTGQAILCGPALARQPEGSRMVRTSPSWMLSVNWSLLHRPPSIGEKLFSQDLHLNMSLLQLWHGVAVNRRRRAGLAAMAQKSCVLLFPASWASSTARISGGCCTPLPEDVMRQCDQPCSPEVKKIFSLANLWSNHGHSDCAGVLPGVLWLSAVPAGCTLQHPVQTSPDVHLEIQE